MTAEQVLRDARRWGRVSQRACAEAAGVPPSTLAGWESGARQPTFTQVGRVLTALGLELELRPADAPPDRASLEAAVAHLRLSLAERLARLAQTCDGPVPGSLRLGPPPLLVGPAAVAMWVPGPPLAEVTVEPVGARGMPTRGVAGHPSGGPATFLVWHVGPARPRLPRERLAAWVLFPTDLLLAGPAMGVTAADAAGLRLAGRLLHERAGRDDAGRRPAAARHPDEDREHADLLLQPRYGGDPAVPVGGLSRAGRVDGPASLQQDLEAHGLVPRHPTDRERRAQRAERGRRGPRGGAG